MSASLGVANAIGEMVNYFIPHCDDTSTLIQLKTMAADRDLWSGGHDLFSRIRSKTLRADKTGNLLLQHQYCFEEICAKTLFNLSGSRAPFDSDSPFWVIPLALGFAAQLKLDNPFSMASVLQPKSDA